MQFEDNPSPHLTIVEQGSTPATPDTGEQKLFIRSSDGHLCRVDDGAGVTDIETAAVGGTSTFPKFSVHKNGTNQTGIVTGTYTKLTWSTELFDTNSNFASDKFTPTVAGYYLIIGAVGFTAFSDTARVEIALYKNGAAVQADIDRSTGTSSMYGRATWIVEMNGSTDYLELYALQATGSNKDVSGATTDTYFQGTRLP